MAAVCGVVDDADEGASLEFTIVCTVVCRWRPDEAVPIQILALRDEFSSRDFDLPDGWWADQPGVIGGRDRRGGGSWCVSDVAAGITAVVLNRPERPAAEAEAPSRGVLPLQAIRHLERWPEFVDVTPMASFNLVVVSSHTLLWWSFDGQQLRRQSLASGTHMFIPRGLRSSPLDRRIATGCAEFGGHGVADTPAVSSELVWAQWLALVRESIPSADPSSLLVQRTVGDESYETVFGQFIAARPGALRIDYLDHVARDAGRPWTTRLWTNPDVSP